MNDKVLSLESYANPLNQTSHVFIIEYVWNAEDALVSFC